MNYEPLSARAIKAIQFYDKQFHNGINRNRFYTWLVQVGSDIQIRHVAVKCHKGTSKRVVKEVARFSVDDDQIYIKDLVFFHGRGGYSVDWRPEGFDDYQCPYDYKGRWESEDYKSTGLWHINATVLNPHLLNRTKRFKYCNWRSECGDIVNYLKTYDQHPGLEMLSKMGLPHWCLKPSIYKKCETDKAFAKFLFRFSADIRQSHYTIPLVLRAYRRGTDIKAQLEARALEEMRELALSCKRIGIVAEEWSWLEKRRGGYCFVLPKVADDLVKEGMALSHCVLEKHYAERVAKGRSIIAFVRKRDAKDVPFVTVEYGIKSGKVEQCYGLKNCKPDPKVQAFVDRAFAGLKKMNKAA